MPQLKPDIETYARIKVIGIGGGGGKAITRMIDHKINGVDFITINTDAQDLHFTKARTKIHIGKNLTKGLGAGMNPEYGRQAAEENRDEIHEALKGADMIFLTCGLGGGTGSGASPIVADVARESGALTIGVVTRPFSFEGRARARIADEAWSQMKDKVDALITIPNDRLLNLINKEMPLLQAFAICDDILRQAVQGISDLIVMPGIINVDFADVRTIMSDTGSALMGVGYGAGEDRAVAAARAAVSSPLLDVSISGARGVLFYVTGVADLTLLEINEAAKVITESIDKEAKVIFGAVQSDVLKKGEIKITVIATGFNQEPSVETDDSIIELAPERSNEPRRPQWSPRPQTSSSDDETWEAPAFLRRKK